MSEARAGQPRPQALLLAFFGAYVRGSGQAVPPTGPACAPSTSR